MVQVRFVHWASGRVTQRTPVPSNTECNIQGGIMATQFFAADRLLETQIIANSPKSPTTTQTFSNALSRTDEWQSAC